MVDTVLKKEDLQSFLKFCSREHQGKTQLLVTPFVEDEKPLVVKVDGNRNEKQSEIVQIGGTFEAGDVVTSGMYCFSPLVFDLFKGQSKDQENQDLKNMNKMRNFLNFLLQNGFKMSSFRVEKTIDIDHPEDIKTAENFLKY